MTAAIFGSGFSSAVSAVGVGDAGDAVASHSKFLGHIRAKFG